MNQGMIMQPLMAAIAFIIILAGMGLLTSGINDWSLLTYDTGFSNGTRIERVVAPATGDLTSKAAWNNDSLTEMSNSGTLIAAGEWSKIAQDGTGCQLTGGTLAAGTVTAIYAQNGEALTLSATGAITPCTWRTASGIWSAFGFQELIRLAFQAAALGLPIAVLYGVYQFGKSFVSNLGVHPLLGVVSLIVIFLLFTRLMDTVTPFVANAADAVGSVQFIVYQDGLGNLGGIVSNFYGVVLASGAIGIGWDVYKLVKGGGMGMGMGMGGAKGGM